MIFKKSNVMDFNLEVSLPRLTQEETQYTSDKIILREAGNNKVLRFSDLYNYAKYNNKSIQESVTDIERENHIANPVFVVNETQYYLDEDYRNAVSDLSVFSKLMFDSNPESGLIYNAMMEAVDYSLENNNTSLLSDADNEYMYFVHSYYIDPEDKDIITAYTDYGGKIPVAIGKDNVFALQFHPEKSGPSGLNILQKFVNQIE